VDYIDGKRGGSKTTFVRNVEYPREGNPAKDAAMVTGLAANAMPKGISLSQ